MAPCQSLVTFVNERARANARLGQSVRNFCIVSACTKEIICWIYLQVDLKALWHSPKVCHVLMRIVRVNGPRYTKFAVPILAERNQV